MAKSKRGRKIVWLAAGVALFAVPLTTPGTFNVSTLFESSSEEEPKKDTDNSSDVQQGPKVEPEPAAESDLSIDTSSDEAKQNLDPHPVAEPVLPEMGVSAVTEPDKQPEGLPDTAPLPENEDPQATWESEAVNSDLDAAQDIPELMSDTNIVGDEPKGSEKVDTPVEEDLEGPEGLAIDESSDATAQPQALNEPAQAEPATWVRVIASGDTLDALLNEAGILANQRYAITSKINEKFKLSRLRPGHELSVVRDLDGNVTNVDIHIDKNNSVLTSIGDTIDVSVKKPETSRVTAASSITINGSLSASLGNADVPSRFATAVANALSGHVNFRRDLKAGDKIDLLWSQKQTEGGDTIGGSDISYARLKSRGRVYDVVWGDGGSPMVFRDGDVIRTFSSPVPGARVSSNYGMRTHPVLGGRRMHDGTDFAAPTGTPVLASTAGVVSYVGRRGAYGRVVEVKHSPSVTTRYAHLHRYGVKRGQRVKAGDRIGSVGSSGRVTGPHLHYEFLLNGRAVDPMARGRWNSLEASSGDREKLNKLTAARKAFEKQKASETKVQSVEAVAPKAS